MAKTHRHTFQAKTKKYRKEGQNVSSRYPKRRNLGHGRPIVGCTCELCKDGMHSNKWSEAKIRRVVRGNRRSVRSALKDGQEIFNDKPSYGYVR
jgi:hypothetical protein